MSLLDPCPQPRLATLRGEPYLVREFRLRDIAMLEGLARDAVGDPVAELEASDLSDPGIRSALRDAFDAAEAGSLLPSWGAGSPLFAAFLKTRPGGAAYLGRALREHEPPPIADAATREDREARAGEHAAWQATLGRLAGPIEQGGLTIEEWSSVMAATAPPDHLHRIDALIIRAVGEELPPPEDPDTTWGEMLGEMCDGDPTRLDALMDLTISQVRFLRSRGARPRLGRECPHSWSQERFRQFLVKLEEFWKEGAGEPEPDPA